MGQPGNRVSSTFNHKRHILTVVASATNSAISFCPVEGTYDNRFLKQAFDKPVLCFLTSITACSVSPCCMASFNSSLVMPVIELGL